MTESKSPKRKIDPELYAQLRAEAKAPYRGLRQFVYFGCGVSGLVGAVIFLAQLIAGRDVDSALPNFALQIGVVALMVGLFRLEQRANRKSIERDKLSKP
jgi:Low psii accumulation1 / Rep27